MAYNILTGDCLEQLRLLPDNSFDGCLSDPPYSISFMGASWDKALPSPEVWAEVLRVCKPGALLLSFGGPRTFHRLAVAIEDGGWQIRDTLCWLHAQGFPHGKNLGQGYNTQLKPAFEPVILAQAQVDGSIGDNFAKWSCGGLNIDGCRIEPQQGDYQHPGNPTQKQSGTVYGWANCPTKYTQCPPNAKGRYPANVLLDEEVAQQLDQQSGETKSVKSNRGRGFSSAGSNDGWKRQSHDNNVVGGYNDKGGASRFFYCAKSSRKERDKGLEALPAKYLATMGDGIGERPHNPDQPSAYVKNNHPCCKPLALCRYLATLILPPKGETPRRILIPYCGSGSECIGALQAGWCDVTGIEREPEYVEIAKARINAQLV